MDLVRLILKRGIYDINLHPSNRLTRHLAIEVRLFLTHAFRLAHGGCAQWHRLGGLLIHD